MSRVSATVNVVNVAVLGLSLVQAVLEALRLGGRELRPM